MKLGVNYLNEAKELFEEGKINFIDYFKLFSLTEDVSAVDWCAKNRFVMFHGLIGEPSAYGDIDLINKTNIEKTKEMIEKSRTPYISGHITVRNKSQTKEETENAIIENVKKYKELFGKDVAIENIPYRDKYKDIVYVLEPEFISKVVHESGAMFLFDISHARKAAEYLNLGFEEYVSRLPMDKVIEFHLAGMTTLDDGSRVDFHGKLNEEDYDFVREAIKKYKTLQYITLEYGVYCPKEEIEKYNKIGAKAPLVSFEGVNEVAKEEVYEQLTKLNEIIQSNKTL